MIRAMSGAGAWKLARCGAAKSPMEGPVELQEAPEVVRGGSPDWRKLPISSGLGGWWSRGGSNP